MLLGHTASVNATEAAAVGLMCDRPVTAAVALSSAGNCPASGGLFGSPPLPPAPACLRVGPWGWDHGGGSSRRSSAETHSGPWAPSVSSPSSSHWDEAMASSEDLHGSFSAAAQAPQLLAGFSGGPRATCCMHSTRTGSGEQGRDGY